MVVTNLLASSVDIQRVGRAIPPHTYKLHSNLNMYTGGGGGGVGGGGFHSALHRY